MWEYLPNNVLENIGSRLIEKNDTPTYHSIRKDQRGVKSAWRKYKGSNAVPWNRATDIINSLFDRYATSDRAMKHFGHTSRLLGHYV
ncbi:hypothetical protein TetV_442 [Tetraselmis virus 1]|uniref:Uncharacterized protein n=1 Tax=Tetraselmis virus 1 TaxID=2060617 RepID=A0A2P0VNP3_9VIRU|nr:hypothetical protein QJ968_gp612 [Tetraselmis virus 1]AUF82524.1 hypothetical protein TetV_442 [Tetraselmis virus 1]